MLTCCFRLSRAPVFVSFFFFNDTATTEIYTLSLHDALPISCAPRRRCIDWPKSSTTSRRWCAGTGMPNARDRKSTRLNSSHLVISYAVFCLKKKKKKEAQRHHLIPSPMRLLPYTYAYRMILC